MQNVCDKNAMTIDIPGGRLEIRLNWCKGCGLCIYACPRHIIKLDEVSKIGIDRPEHCSKCGRCENICPDFAIRVIKND